MSAPQNNEPQTPTAVRTTPGISIAALILGILSIPLTFLTGIPALILGIIGMKKTRAHTRGRGMAIAGIILGWICSMLGLYLCLIFLPGFISLRERAYDASATSAGRNARLAEEVYYQDGGGDQGSGYTNKLTNLLAVDPNLTDDTGVKWVFGECSSTSFTFTTYHEKTMVMQVFED